jgi:hypothetical protein
MTYEMKPLSCDPARLKGLSERLIVSHYENNYGGAVKRLNAIAAQLWQLDLASAPVFVVNGLKREELVATNSMILHELYFDGLGKQSEPGPMLREALTRDFGSYERWNAEFTEWGRRWAGVPAGCFCRGRHATESSSTNGPRTIAIRSRAARRSSPSICMNMPITWTLAPKRPATSTRSWALSAGATPIGYSTR